MGRKPTPVRSVTEGEEDAFFHELAKKKRAGMTTDKAVSALSRTERHWKAVDAVKTRWPNPDARRKALERRLSSRGVTVQLAGAPNGAPNSG